MNSMNESSQVIEAKISKELKESFSSDVAAKYDQKLKDIDESGQSSYIWTSFVSILFSCIIFYSPIGKYLKEKFVNYVEFNFRDYIGKSPAMAPNLKLVVKDDNSISYLKKTILDVEEWAVFLEYLASHNPKAIYIDKIFSMTQNSSGSAREEVKYKEALRRIEAIQVPIYVGSSTNSGRISAREPLRFDSELYRLSRYMPNQDEQTNIAEKMTGLIKHRADHVYSVHPDFAKSFHSTGIQYNSERSIAPIINIDDAYILPHLGVMPAEQIKILDKQKILVNEQIVKLNHGQVVVNYLKPQQVYSQARSFKSIFRRLPSNDFEQAAKYDFFAPGDHIFVVPEFFTGSTDFKDTPFGRIFGGIVVTSLMNSVLTGEWITEIDSSIAFIIVLAGFVTLISLLSPVNGWIAILGFIALNVISGLYLFAYYNISFPWLFVSLGVFVSGTPLLATKAKLEKKKQDVMDQMKTESQLISKENLLFEENQNVLLKEKQEASEIASAFMPDSIPCWKNITVKAFHKCFDAASGDWYFFQQSNDGRYQHMVMCDITGHGVQAAIIVSTCKAVLNSNIHLKPDLINRRDFIEIFAKNLNDILYKQGKGNHLTTYAGITFDSIEQTITYVTCAHPPPILHKFTGEQTVPKILRLRNDPLGFSQEFEPSSKTIPFAYRDTLVVFTDGVPINENIRFYRKFLSSRGDKWNEDPEDLYHFIWDAIYQRNGSVPDDDVSLMIIQNVSEEESSNLIDDLSA